MTDGLRSKQTAKVYKSTFSEFIRYLQNINLRILLDYRHDVIESKIISFLEYLENISENEIIGQYKDITSPYSIFLI